MIFLIKLTIKFTGGAKMELYEVMFLLGFLTTIAITLYKTYNTLTGWQKYDFTGAIILFIGVILGWGVVFFINIIKYDNTVVKILYLLSTGLFVLNIVFMTIESFNLVTDTAGITTRKRYDPKDKNPRKAFNF